MKDCEQFLRDINNNLNIKVVVFEKRLQLSDGITQVGYMGWDLQIWMQMKCNVVLNELNRLPNYRNITSVFTSKFSNYRHISNNFWKKKLIMVNKVWAVLKNGKCKFTKNENNENETQNEFWYKRLLNSICCFQSIKDMKLRSTESRSWACILAIQVDTLNLPLFNEHR